MGSKTKILFRESETKRDVMLSRNWTYECEMMSYITLLGAYKLQWERKKNIDVHFSSYFTETSSRGCDYKKMHARKLLINKCHAFFIDRRAGS